MTHSDRQSLERRFVAILENHKGMVNAISVQAMAKALGLGDGKSGQRMTQLIKRAVVDAGQLVGSSCGKVSGYYAIENEAEIRATLKQYSSRFYSLSVLIKTTRASLGKVDEPQMVLF